MTRSRALVDAIGGLPATKPDDVRERSWRLTLEHVRDGRSYRTLAAAEGITTERVGQLVTTACQRIVSADCKQRWLAAHPGDTP